MTDLELLSNRLKRMENRFRWMLHGGILLGAMLLAGIVMAQRVPQELNQIDPLRTIRRSVDQTAVPKSPVEAEVRAQHFVLVDEKGRERASLVADAAGSVFLVMFDTNQKTRAQLSVGNEGPSLIFYDPSARARTVLGSTTLVPSHVNDNGVAEKAPASSIVLFDRTGKLLFRTP
jgi:hypothetical protein